MPSLTFALRAGGLIAAATLASSLMACAAEPEIKFVSPTMAPEQSLIEACAISGEEVDRLTLEAEQKIRGSLEQAGAELASGQIPSIDALTGTLNDTLAEVEGQISNAEVLDSIAQVREAMRGFQDIAKPESALGVPGYVASLGSQLNELAKASKQLQALCSSN